MTRSGDGWAVGPDGTRMWGLFGAAGLVAHDPARGILLQHRAVWSHLGGTWGIPGGAIDEGETAIDAALRESFEEAAVPAERLRLRCSYVHDRGYWSYTTVLANVTKPFDVHIADPESRELAWVPVAEVDQLELHPGFEAAWPELRRLLTLRCDLIIDVANVMGSRPNGWWRDRAGAAAKLIAELAPLAEAGCPGRQFDDAAAHVWPRLTFVLEGEARAAATVPAPPGTRILTAAGSGDDAIVEAIDPVYTTMVVTSDRELRRRVTARGARFTGPSSVLPRLTGGKGSKIEGASVDAAQATTGEV